MAEPDFPGSAVGQEVDIKGYTGVIAEVVNHSIKVRSAEGTTMSYNFHTLRRLYGPRTETETAATEPKPDAPAASPPPPKREVILEPDFNTALVPIEQVVHHPDFPKCAFGRFIDLHGYSGVVVELVGHSLKVRSREGTTRSYNADGLRRIYSQLAPGHAPAIG